MRIVVRGSESITWSRETIQAIKDAGMRFTKVNRFNRPDDYVIINHGNPNPIEFGPRVRSAYVINDPTDIHLSVNKNEMLDKIKDTVDVPNYTYLPNGQRFLEAIDEIGLPAILKPNVGHKGHGMKVIKKPSELMQLEQPRRNSIIQTYLNVTSEYRFNFLNGELIQVSRKLLPDERDRYPGVFDGWISLGMATKLHKRAHTMAKTVQEAFPFGSIAVDVIRCGTDPCHYWFGEINTAYGIGPMTAERLKTAVQRQWNEDSLQSYKVV